MSTHAAVAVGLWLLGIVAAQGAVSEPLTLANAEVLKVDRTERSIVIKDNNGKERTLKLEDSASGLDTIDVGDRVVLTLRGAPGNERIRMVAKSQASTAGSAAQGTVTIQPPPRPVSAEAAAARESFKTKMAELAKQASRVDERWAEFRSRCDVTVRGDYTGAREWFSIWDSQVRADLSNEACQKLQDEIVVAGEPIKAAMTAAEDEARQSVEPGTIREIRKEHLLDWEGWGRAAPGKP